MSRITRSIRRAAACTALAASLAGCPDAHQQAADFNPCSASRAIDTCQRDADDYAGSWAAMDDYLTDMLDRRGYAGCGIGVMVDDEITYLATQGYANLPDQAGDWDQESFDAAEPFGMHTMALTASVTKTVVAAAVLEELGHRLPGDPNSLAISLDQRVDELLPMPDGDYSRLGEITLHQLLSHNSGISSASYDPEMNSDSELQELFPALAHPGMHPRVAWYAFRERTMHAVNPVTDYENFNYRILGSIIDFHTISDPDEVGFGGDDVLDWSAEMAGQDWMGGFEVYLRENIAEQHDDLPLDTLCMRTPWRVQELDYSGIAARGYALTDDEDDDIWDSYTELGVTNSNGMNGASGSLMMTIGDLTRLMKGLSDGTLASPETLSRMTTPYGTDTGLNSTLGYGLHLPTQTFNTATGAVSVPAWQAAGSKGSDGFGAGFRVATINGRTIGAALLCNSRVTLTPQNTELSAMLQIIYDTYVAPGISAEDGPISPDPAAAQCPDVELTALDALEVDWATPLQQQWKALLAQSRGDAREAEQAARRLLIAERGGRDVLAAYDRGQLVRAASLLSDVLARKSADLTRR